MVKFLAISILAMMFSFSAHASDAPAEGKEEAAQEDPNAVTKIPWAEAENKVQELSSRIISKKNQIQNLLIEKQALKEDSPQVKEVVDSLMKEHRELAGLVENYEKNLTLLKYRFPERSAKNKRVYKKIEMQSIDDIETEMGIDGKLSRNMQRMRSHYGTKAPSQEKRVPASVGSGVEKVPEGSIENPAPIVIKK